MQFLLGTAVNLFVAIPPDHSGAHADNYIGGVAESMVWAITQAPLTLVLHTFLGLLLVLTAIGICFAALRERRRAPLVAAALGAIGILAAGVNGGSFLVSGENYSSMLMAAGFAIAVTAYSVAMFLSPPHKTTLNRTQSSSGDEY